jgi:prepilin-type N-terminal cleavage/methylation domain-containing protein
MTPRATDSHGFTMIEVLAVLFLTALVIGVALDFYVDLSNQSARASEVTRDVRRATGLLDRIARDLQRTLLVKKPAEEDPLAHPWVFVAESHLASEGSDRVKFVSRQPNDRADRQTSGLSMVSFILRESADGDGYELQRWSSPSLPESLDRDFPLPDDPDALTLAKGVHHFALRFLDESGEWVPEWDSSQLLDSSALPLAIEIQVAMAPLDFESPEQAQEGLYRRRVQLPVRPLDLETLLDPEATLAEADDEDADCEGLLVRDCVDLSLLSQAEAQAAEGSGIDFEAILDSSWCSIKDLYGDHPAVKASCR